MSFVDEFMKKFGPEVSKQLVSNLGINNRTATDLIPEIAPLILGGLKRQMETRGGEERLNHILNKYGKADVLDRIGDEISSRSRTDRPDPRLGGLLGDSGVEASKLISKKFKLDPGLAMKLIPMLAPIILGALSNKRDKEGAGSGGLASMLDKDGDGSILDDVAGFLLRGGAPKKSRSGGGLLGGLLGSLLGKRR